MKYMRFIVLGVIFICMIVYFKNQSDKKWESLDKYLDNDVFFEGIVTNIKQSDNHSFGIIQLKLTKSSVEEFDKVIKEGIYPYKIKGNVAELYTSIPDGLQNLDTFIIDSKSHSYKFEYRKDKTSYNSLIYIITDTFDINFVKTHTMFK